MADALLGGIVINEILADPNGALNYDTDGNGTAHHTDEYVELYNTSTGAIDISGLQLWDAGVGNYFTFPPGTVLQAGGHAMVITGVQAGGSLPTGGPNDLFFDVGRTSALINNGGDNVIVYDPANDQYIDATFNGDTQDNPTLGRAGYGGFSSTATQVGTGEAFGFDTDGLSLQRNGDGANTFFSDVPTPGTANVCFANGTRFRTPRGQRRVENLKPGDKIETADHGARRVRWIYAKSWTAADIRRNPKLAPVLIRAGALGPGLPHNDLRLSQQHRVLVQGAIAQRMFGAPEILIAARHLIALDGVSIDTDCGAISYYHVMLEQHEILLAEGIRAESLYLGVQAPKACTLGFRR